MADQESTSEQIVCVKVFVNRHEAELAKGALEASGIQAHVAADDAGGELPGLDITQGVGVFVRQSDVGVARQALNSGEGGGS